MNVFRDVCHQRPRTQQVRQRFRCGYLTDRRAAEIEGYLRQVRRLYDRRWLYSFPARIFATSARNGAAQCLKIIL